MQTQSRFPSRFAPIALALHIATTGVLFAGPLTPPPGPITSTNKTLTEVEPRTAISLANTPGDANSLFKITQPGSYYLTGNITGVAGMHGIEIATTGVSIDLNGFELRGIPGSFDGITNSTATVERTSIRNGSVTAWGGAGIRLTSNSFSGVVESILASTNGSIGIGVGNSFSVSHCSATSNGSTGFVAATSSAFNQCVSRANQSDGFSMTSDCTLSDCIARDNTGNGFSCSFPGNTFQHCVATGSVHGFSVNSDALVTNCTARENSGNGIRGASGCRILANNCIDNGLTTGDGAGIHVTGSDNRIEGNNCTTADRGIDVDAAGNIIIKNTCSGNTVNWSLAAGNHYGPIIDRTVVAAPPAVSGNSATEALGSTHPNANFTY